MEGSVCFIDLLGFSQLTKDAEKQKNIKIIDKYINGLHKTIWNLTRDKEIDFTVLSDSVFLFTERQHDELLVVIAEIFRACIKSGILLRAGLNYGEYTIYRTELSKNNIYGAAVTKAVELEKSGKGCRCFINSDYPVRTGIEKTSSYVFKEYKNYENYTLIDVFEWPLVSKEYIARETDRDSKELPNESLRSLLFRNFELSTILQYSPSFAWNVASSAGAIQVHATIEYITTLIDVLIKQTDIEEEAQKSVDYISADQKRSVAIVKAVTEIMRKVVFQVSHQTANI